MLILSKDLGVNKRPAPSAHQIAEIRELLGLWAVGADSMTVRYYLSGGSNETPQDHVTGSDAGA